MKKYYRLFYIAIFSLFAYLLPVNSANNPNIINFDRTEYQASNKNWSISEDDKGVMYFGNDLGLLEFDGIKWSLHKMAKEQTIRSVFAMSNNTIYTGGYEEFGVWKRAVNGKLEYTSLSEKFAVTTMHSDDIWRIWSQGSEVFFQSFRGIYIYDGKKITEISDKSILFVNRVYDELWVQAIKGALYKIEEKKYIKIEGSDFFSDTDVRFMLPFENKEYLIGTSDKGLFIYDGKKFSRWNTSQNLSKKDLNCGILSTNGYYYLGTIQDGVYIVAPDGKVVNHFNSESILQNNTVLSIYEDSFQNIWTALDRGITCIEFSNNLSYYIDPSGRIGAVYAAAIFDNKLYVGTNQGVYYVDTNEMSSMQAISQLKSIPEIQGQIWNLKVIDDKLYCCYNSGLRVIEKNRVVRTPYPSIQDGIFSIVDSENNIYLASYNTVYQINKRRNNLSKFEDINEPISNIVIDHQSNIWLESMNKGVYKCRIGNKENSFESITYFGKKTFPELPDQFKLFDVSGRAAFAGDNKIYTYNDINGKIQIYQPFNLVLDQIGELKRVVSFGQDNLWFIGNNTLYNVSYNGETAKIKSSIDIGGKNMVLINNYENIIQLNDSLNLICLDNGFIIHNIKQSSSKKSEIYPPYFKAFLAKNSNGKELYQSITESINLSNKFNTIQIGFSSIDAFSNNIYFQYKIDELEDWSSQLKINEVTYERLPKGRYTFSVRAVDRLGNYSEPVSFNFEIESAWYESNTAYALYVLSFFIIIIAIWFFNLRYYERLHRKKIKIWEAQQLKIKNEQLQNEIEKKNAELLTQASFFVRKNELLANIRNTIEEFYSKTKSQQLLPLYQKLNSILNNNLDAEDDWKMFLIKFEEKHTNFFKNLKASYPDLTSNDLRLCACLKLNLDTKDIASLMNLSVRAVENSRYRLRKKLNIQSSQSLYDFFFNID